MRKHLGWFFWVILLLLVSLLPLIIVKAQGLESDTRYFRSDYATVLGLTGHSLHINQSTGGSIQSMSASSGGTYQIGIRIWRRDINQIEYETTSGTPIGIVQRRLMSGLEQGYQSQTWEFPETDYNVTDSLVIRSYIRKSITDWNDEPYKQFTTEQIGATTFNNVIWNITYWTKLAIGASWVWEWGYSYSNSIIENFNYTLGINEQVYSESNIVSSGLTLINSSNANGNLTGNYADAYEKWKDETWDFTIENHTISGNLSSVQLQLKHYQTGYFDDGFKIQIYDGFNWHTIRNYPPQQPPTIDIINFFNLDSILDTWEKVDLAKLRIISTAKTGAEDSVIWYVDTVKLTLFCIEEIEPNYLPILLVICVAVGICIYYGVKIQ